MRRSNSPTRGTGVELRRRPISRPSRRAGRPLSFEPLEDRTLWRPWISRQPDHRHPVQGHADLHGLAAVTGDGLTVKTSTVKTPPTAPTVTPHLMYTFTDSPNDPITLGPGAIADGWTGRAAANTVTGPGSKKSVNDGGDAILVRHRGRHQHAGRQRHGRRSRASGRRRPWTSTTPGERRYRDARRLGGAQNIAGNVTITNTAGTTALTVNDSGDTKPETVFVSGARSPTWIRLSDLLRGGQPLLADDHGRQRPGHAQRQRQRPGPGRRHGGLGHRVGDDRDRQQRPDQLREFPGRQRLQRGRPAVDAGEPDDHDLDGRRADRREGVHAT